MQPEEQHEFKQPDQAAYVPSSQPEEAAPANITDTTPVLNTEQPLETTPQPDAPTDADTDALHWQAAEYIQHQRNPLWYVALIAIVVILMAMAVLWIKSWTFAILVPVMALALVVYVRRPAAVIDYTLSAKGMFINDTLHSFHEFKAFGVIHDGNEYSVQLIPVRRFRPSLSVYFPEESGEKIVDMLGVRLPMEQLKPDAFDKIVHFLRI